MTNPGIICADHIHDADCGYAPGSDAIEGTAERACTAAHEDGAHDDACGYAAEVPAVEAVPETPCNHRCDLCAERDSDLPPLSLASSKDVTTILENVKFTVTQDDKDIAEGGNLNPTDDIKVVVKFNVPVGGDDGVDEDAINAGDTATFQLAAGLGTREFKDKPLIFKGEEVGKLTISYNAEETTIVGDTTIKGVSTAVVTFSKLVDNRVSAALALTLRPI